MKRPSFAALAFFSPPSSSIPWVLCPTDLRTSRPIMAVSAKQAFGSAPTVSSKEGSRLFEILPYSDAKSKD
jgi:hypothetical protein